MTTLRKEVVVDTPADHAWSRLSDVRRTHELFAGVLLDCHIDGDIRTVVFANGMTVVERLITIDDALRRISAISCPKRTPPLLVP